MSCELQDLNRWISQLASTTKPTGIQPIQPHQAPIIVSENWQDDYYRVLKNPPYTRVFEVDDKGRKHDHTPMPHAELITSLQAGLIEKPKKEKQPKRKPLTPPYRHKLCIEVWTVPHDQIVRHKLSTQWRRFAQMRLEAGFEATVQKAVKDGYVTTEFKEWTLSKVYNRGPNQGDSLLWGVFHDNNGGWNYYDEHLLKLDLRDPAEPKLTIWRDREIIVGLMPLDPKFAGHALPDGSTETHNGRINV